MPPSPLGRRLGALIVVAALLRSQPAIACVTDPQVSVAEPVRGAAGVPTNIALWLYGDTFTGAYRLLLESDDGGAVPFTVRPNEPLLGGSWASVLRPNAPLRPRTRYTFRTVLVAASAVVYETSFETGDGPDERELEAIRVDGVQAVDNTLRGSCGYNATACVGMSYRGVVDVVIRQRCGGAPIDHYLTRATDDGLQVFYDGVASQVPFCAELRARRADGALGPATSFCTDPEATALVLSACPVRCRGGAVTLNDEPVGPPPNEHIPDQCLRATGLTPERWPPLRATWEANRARGCEPSDGGRADAARGDGFTVDAASTEAAVDAGDVDAGTRDAVEVDAGLSLASAVDAPGCGCRVGGSDRRASFGWVAAMVMAWASRRRSR